MSFGIRHLNKPGFDIFHPYLSKFWVMKVTLWKFIDKWIYFYNGQIPHEVHNLYLSYSTINSSFYVKFWNTWPLLPDKEINNPNLMPRDSYQTRRHFSEMSTFYRPTDVAVTQWTSVNMSGVGGQAVLLTLIDKGISSNHYANWNIVHCIEMHEKLTQLHETFKR